METDYKQNLHCIISKEEYFDICWRRILHKSWKWLIFYAILIVLMLVSYIISSFSGYWIACFFLLLMVIFMFGSFRRSIKRGYDQSVKLNNLEYDVTIFEDHFDIQTKNGNASYEFQQIHSVKSVKGFYLLYTTSVNMVIIPKYRCTPETEEILKKWVSR